MAPNFSPTIIADNNVNVASSINAGAIWVTVYNHGGADITFAGFQVKAGTSYNLPYIGTTYGQLNYNCIGSSVNISYCIWQ